MTVYRVEVLGAAKLKAALTGDIGDAAMKSGLQAGANIVQNQAKRDVHVVSGKLHDSTLTTIEGSGWNTAAHVGPHKGYGGPRVSASGEKGRRANPSRRVNKSDPRDYARRYNLGFHGTDSLGRHFDQKPNRYLIEALQENVPAILRAVQRQFEAVLARKLR